MFFQKIRLRLADWLYQRKRRRRDRRTALAKLKGHESSSSSCPRCAAALRDTLGTYPYHEAYLMERKRCWCGGTRHFLGFNERWYSLKPGSSAWICDCCFATQEASPPRPELADHEIGIRACVVCRRTEPFRTCRDEPNETCGYCGGIMHTFGVEVFEWEESSPFGLVHKMSGEHLVLQCDRCFSMNCSRCPPYSGPPLKKYRDLESSDPWCPPYEEDS